MDTTSSCLSHSILQQLLKQSRLLQDAGRVDAAIQLGPDILLAYFEKENGYPLPKSTPKNFREKLFRRMLDAHEYGAPVFTQLSDKLHVRSYFQEKGLAANVPKLLWHGNNASDIPWSHLPKVCMLKCSEGSGKNMLLAYPYDKEAAAIQCEAWQRSSYYWFRREFHYLKVPRSLLIEEFLKDDHPDGPIDFIFYCFDGVPRLIQVGSRSHAIHGFYSTSWEPIKLTYRAQHITPDIPRPTRLESMLMIAAKLSKGFDFVRVDLYQCGEEVKIGELTFTPRAGYLPFDPSGWNDLLGEYWKYRYPGLDRTLIDAAKQNASF